jgi:hypothetical protein
VPQAVFAYFLRFAMAWPNYHFVDLSAAEKVARRQTLDKYALYAQLSALVPVAAVLLYRLAKWVVASKGSRNGNYAVVPSSPVQKVRRHSSLGTCASRSRRARWWLGEDVVAFGTVLGQRDRTCSLSLLPDTTFQGLHPVYCLYCRSKCHQNIRLLTN